jgi:hypothetical protein
MFIRSIRSLRARKESTDPGRSTAPGAWFFLLRAQAFIFLTVIVSESGAIKRELIENFSRVPGVESNLLMGFSTACAD